MADDIVERLRTAPPSMLGVRLEAAALIEAQQSEIERLRAVLSDIDALACNVGRPDEAVDYWVTGYADAMQKVKALLHRKKVRRD